VAAETSLYAGARGIPGVPHGGHRSVGEPEWVVVPGNGSTVGDLLWSATPLIGPDRGTRLPVTMVSWGQAALLATGVGGRLPTTAEWTWMAAGPRPRCFPWGDEPWSPPRANLRGSGLGRPTAVDAHPRGATPEGVVDVAGNVWEWTATVSRGRGVVIRGGSYQSPCRYATCVYDGNEVPPGLRSPGIGARVVREP
jgi:formylglycine-generating enzyme